MIVYVTLYHRTLSPPSVQSTKDLPRLKNDYFYLVLDLGISTKRKLEFSLDWFYFFVCLILTQVNTFCVCE